MISSRLSEYSPMSTESSGNNCLGFILRGEYRGLQNNGIKHINADAYCSFAYTYAAVVLISLHLHR